MLLLPITRLPEALLSHTSPVTVSATNVCPFESANCILSMSFAQPSTAHSMDASRVR